MNTDNFEERIKDAFERHRPEADTAAIWENIEPHLKKKKKRRFIIFFWLLGLGLLTFHFQHDGWVRFAPSAADSPKSENTSVSAAAAAPRDIARSEMRSAAAENDAFPNAGIKSAPAGKSTNANSAEKEREVAQKVEVPNDFIADIRDDDATSVAGPEVPAPRDTFALDATISAAISATSATAMRDHSTTDVKAVESGEKSNKQAQNDEKKPERRKKSKKRKSPWEHNLGIQAGPALAIRQLGKGGSSVSAPAGLLEGRKATEHTMESFTAGMFYSAATRKGLVLKTGLEYRQTNEKFQLAYSNKETEVINGILTITVDNAGNAIGQTTGNKTVTTTTEYSNTAYNHYRFVHLPVGAGYRHSAKKSRWELLGGVDFNLLFRAEGTIYNSNIIPTPFQYGTTFYDNTFRNSTGMGLWASYAYDWRLTDRLRWQLSANAQMPLYTVSSPDYELVQRYFNFGVQVGLVYQVTKGKTGK